MYLHQFESNKEFNSNGKLFCAKPHDLSEPVTIHYHILRCVIMVQSMFSTKYLHDYWLD